MAKKLTKRVPRHLTAKSLSRVTPEHRHERYRRGDDATFAKGYENIEFGKRASKPGRTVYKYVDGKLKPVS